VITDIFARRYTTTELRAQYFEEDRRFFTQAAAMVTDLMWLGRKSDNTSDATELNLKEVHDLLALELGREFLSDRWWFRTYTFNGNTSETPHTNSYAAICKTFLTKIPQDMAQSDTWVKERLSFVELAYQRRLAQVAEINRNLPLALARVRANNSGQQFMRTLAVPGSQVEAVQANNDRINAAFAELVRDLNERLRLAKYGLVFHNGLIQVVSDEQTNEQVAKPFWSLVSGEPWKNVDAQMKEAIDCRDNGDRTAAFHAVSALESCIKIISEIKGWTNGKEKGAANYVDNLASKRSSQFIEQWEAEMLKSMFSDVRNPFAHGPGLAPMPNLQKEQTDWAIDTAMSWIKSLIRRT
jgi:AbiJ N-terminal domain 4